MRKNIRKIKLKKLRLVLTTGLLILILLGTLIYFGSKNKKIEASTQPMEEEELVAENPNEENINNIEEVPENTIDENIENNEEKNNTDNKNNNTKDNTNNTKNNAMPYYIKVNYGAQVVTIYKKDSNGDYTVPEKAMICSTGISTPKSGVYSIPGRWTWGALFGNVYGQYCVKITGNILFHSVPYLRKGDPASLEYWEYDKLGTAASAGCVRLKVEDLIWLYNNCANGTKVEFYSSSDPGPLGKPSAKKISDYPDYLRNWDPTDPNPNNPWKTYNEQQKNENSSNKNNNNNIDNNNDNNNNNSNTNDTSDTSDINNINNISNDNNDSQTKTTITMPDLIGLSEKQAEQKLSELGLQCSVKLITSLSKDTVFYQSVPANTNKTASEYGTITIKAYKKVNQVETKVNVVNSSGNVDYNGKNIKLEINGTELNDIFNGSSFLGISTISTPNISVKVYIDNILVKSQDFNFDDLSKANENTTSSMSVTVNI